jgi:hypothetical protein
MKFNYLLLIMMDRIIYTIALLIFCILGDNDKKLSIKSLKEWMQ